MSKHVTVSLRIQEWEEDGDTTKREIIQEVSGGFDKLTWSRFQIRGQQPTPRELELLAMIGQSIDELANEQ